MNELVEPLEERAGHQSGTRRVRMVAVEALGPLTILGGIVWAIAQPYRLVFLRDDDRGVWDVLGQPPLLVVLVGLLFSILIAPGLLEDMRAVEAEEGGGDAAEA